MTSCKTLSMALLSFVALFSTAVVAEDNQPPAGFASLFNGQDMTGWKAGPEGHWKADSGVMVYDGKAMNLVSEKSFGDFIRGLARQVRGPRPLTVPARLFALAAPYAAIAMGNTWLPLSNAKAKTDLGWTPLIRP